MPSVGGVRRESVTKIQFSSNAPAPISSNANVQSAQSDATCRWCRDIGNGKPGAEVEHGKMSGGKRWLRCGTKVGRPWRRSRRNGRGRREWSRCCARTFRGILVRATLGGRIGLAGRRRVLCHDRNWPDQKRQSHFPNCSHEKRGVGKGATTLRLSLGSITHSPNLLWHSELSEQVDKTLLHTQGNYRCKSWVPLNRDARRSPLDR